MCEELLILLELHKEHKMQLQRKLFEKETLRRNPELASQSV